MKIHFFGASRTTTGSMYLIEVNGKKLLLECGLFQGHRQESETLNKVLPFDTKQVDAVVLSHAHLRAFGGGFLGVDIFFVISGFLITRLSIQRWGTLEQISIPAFYRLRFARIVPCLLLLLLVISVLHAAGAPEIAA